MSCLLSSITNVKSEVKSKVSSRVNKEIGRVFIGRSSSRDSRKGREKKEECADKRIHRIDEGWNYILQFIYILHILGRDQ